MLWSCSLCCCCKTFYSHWVNSQPSCWFPFSQRALFCVKKRLFTYFVRCSNFYIVWVKYSPCYFILARSKVLEKLFNSSKFALTTQNWKWVNLINIICLKTEIYGLTIKIQKNHIKNIKFICFFKCVFSSRTSLNM